MRNRGDSGARAEDLQRAQNPGLQSALEECVARFLMGLSPEETEDRDRIYFHIQEAHWYYRDLLCEQTPELPRMSLGSFGSSLLSSSEVFRLLYPSDGERTALYDRWRDFGRKVPQMGCILLDAALRKVLLVQQKSGYWMFPRTKVYDGEAWPACAARAVKDELGLDVASTETAGSPFLDYADAETHTFARFYVALPRADIAPRDRAEWFLLEDLPGWEPGRPAAKGANSFYTVEAVAPDLRRWVEDARKSGPKPVQPRGPETTPEAEETEEKQRPPPPTSLPPTRAVQPEVASAPPREPFAIDVDKVLDRVRGPWAKESKEVPPAELAAPPFPS